MKWMDMGPFTVCNVGLCTSARSWNALMIAEVLGPHRFPEGPEAVWFPTAKSGPISVVAVPKPFLEDRHVAIGYCIHEAVHVWQDICDYIKAGRTGKEIEAYSVQWIAGWLIKELKL